MKAIKEVDWKWTLIMGLGRAVWVIMPILFLEICISELDKMIPIGSSFVKLPFLVIFAYATIQLIPTTEIIYVKLKERK